MAESPSSHSQTPHLFLPSSTFFSPFLLSLTLCLFFPFLDFLLSLPLSLFLSVSPPLRSSHGPTGDDKVMSYLRFLGMWVTVHYVPWAMAGSVFVWVWVASSLCFLNERRRQMERRGGGESVGEWLQKLPGQNVLKMIAKSLLSYACNTHTLHIKHTQVLIYSHYHSFDCVCTFSMCVYITDS